MMPTPIYQQSKGLAAAFRRSIARYGEAMKPARLGFIVDATGSRAATWEEAQAAQRRLFAATRRVKRLKLRLIHFGGDELHDHDWQEKADTLTRAMAGVRCERGLTQFLPALRRFIDEPADHRASAIVLTGDCFEEDADEAEHIAKALKQAGIRLFCFHEGNDEFAGGVFRMLARTTGGSFARLGDELNLTALCEAVALLTAGGREALARLPDSRAKRLLLADHSDQKGDKR
jgi:hypothetical protein